MTKEKWRSFFPIIIFLVAFAAATGWFIKDFYHKDSMLMAVKFRVNDLVLLTLIIPLSVVMFILAHKGRIWAKVFVLGIIIYLAFTYGINVFSCHQNKLFLVYIALFSLCVFSIGKGFSDIAQSVKKPSKTVFMRIISAALLFIAISGYAFWLSDAIVSTITGETSQSLAGMNLPVNVAQVLDMAFMLPLAIIGAIKLWKYHSEGIVISAVMLVFFMLIGISVITMEFGLVRSAGIEMDTGKVIGFGFNTFISFVAIIITYKVLLRKE